RNSDRRPSSFLESMFLRTSITWVLRCTGSWWRYPSRRGWSPCSTKPLPLPRLATAPAVPLGPCGPKSPAALSAAPVELHIQFRVVQGGHNVADAITPGTRISFEQRKQPSLGGTRRCRVVGPDP